MRPLVGSELPAAAWDFAKAFGKFTSIPITSPVERISGPSKESTNLPSGVANLLKGSTASLTAIGELAGM